MDAPAARCWVVSGPTAVGKGTVVRMLARAHPEVFVSVSATTRAPRPDEVDGVSYHFVSGDHFDSMVAAGELLEWAEVHGAAKYGTPKAPVADALAAGRPVILEIDLQGARQVRSSMPEARHVFIAPPSWEELVARSTKRATETDDQRAARLETARGEMAASDEFDHVIVNASLGRAVADLVTLLGLSPEEKTHLDNEHP